MINFLLFLLLLILSPETVAAQPLSYEYVELRLALQWPISYCNTGNPKIGCNPPIPPKFTVHGLWPNRHSEGFFNCPTPNPSIKKLYQQVSTDLWNDLEIYWPNLNSQTKREYLWEHEYEKHGYCFTRFQSPVDYFQTALGIAANIVNIMPNMRSRSGKTLTSGQFYHVDDFRNVITIAGSKLILGLRCNYARNTKFPQLLEIVFCIDTNKKPKNCPYYVVTCNNPWRDSNRVDQTGWFLFP